MKVMRLTGPKECWNVVLHFMPSHDEVAQVIVSEQPFCPMVRQPRKEVRIIHLTEIYHWLRTV
jgi:hypothetical protein